MGTRNLTVIINNNSIVVSQYGQWDGYFSCTGKEILNSIKENKLYKESNLTEFKNKVNLLTPCSSALYSEVNNTINQYNKRKDNIHIPCSYLFPQFCRDTGWRILNLINTLPVYEFSNYTNKYPIHISNCEFDIEYIYCIDLDCKEVYCLTIHDVNNPIIYDGNNISKLVYNTYIEGKKYPYLCFLKANFKDLNTTKKLNTLCTYIKENENNLY